MNPVASRINEMSVVLEDTGHDEIVLALQLAAKEIERLEETIRKTKPTQKHMRMVCGVDCHPGDANCNNYCNMAPQKGPMADKAPPGPDAQPDNGDGERS